MKPNGVVLYRGASLLNSERIVVVATGLTRKSKNPKTGTMVQTYILPDTGLTILESAFSGKDESVCGDCPHRPKDGKLGSCYVDLSKGPQAVYKAFLNGSYPRFNKRKHLAMFAGRVLRLGAYGDPAAVPMKVWDTVCGVVKHWTGYTHQWRKCDKAYAKYCMASCESVAHREEAMAMGYRTFRTRMANEPVSKGEFICPASGEGGKRLSCIDCKACSGAKNGGANASPTIIVHGLAWKIQKYEANVKAGRIALAMAYEVT